jgi:transcriptional regulator with XRE-family HTH domain
MKNEYGKMFKQIRKDKGLTQLEVSNILGWTSKQMVSNVERGLCFFSPEALSKLGKIAGFPIKDLAEMQLDAKVESLRSKYGRMKK